MDVTSCVTNYYLFILFIQGTGAKLILLLLTPIIKIFILSLIKNKTQILDLSRYNIILNK